MKTISPTKQVVINQNSVLSVVQNKACVLFCPQCDRAKPFVSRTWNETLLNTEMKYNQFNCSVLSLTSQFFPSGKMHMVYGLKPQKGPPFHILVFHFLPHHQIKMAGKQLCHII